MSRALVAAVLAALVYHLVRWLLAADRGVGVSCEASIEWNVAPLRPVEEADDGMGDWRRGMEDDS